MTARATRNGAAPVVPRDGPDDGGYIGRQLASARAHLERGEALFRGGREDPGALGLSFVQLRAAVREILSALDSYDGPVDYALARQGRQERIRDQA